MHEAYAAVRIGLAEQSAWIQIMQDAFDEHYDPKVCPEQVLFIGPTRQSRLETNLFFANSVSVTHTGSTRDMGRFFISNFCDPSQGREKLMTDPGRVTEIRQSP